MATLGDAVRQLALAAINSGSGECVTPVKGLYRHVYGLDDIMACDEDFKPGGKYHMTKLKASYVANTVARMPEAQEADVRAKLSFGEMEYNDEMQYCVKVSVVKGAAKKGSKVKANDEIGKRYVEEFKERVLKLSPNIIDFEGDELSGAVKAIRMYQELIKEMK